MKSKILGLVAVGLLAGPLAANATQVSWLFQGTVNDVSGWPTQYVQPLNSFSFVLHFDTATPVTNQPCNTNLGGPGTVCRHNGDPTMYFSDILFNGLVLPQGSVFAPEPAGNNQIIVRNNADISSDPNIPNIIDGYTFVTRKNFTNGDFAQFFVALRGPENLNFVIDGRNLPADPPAGWQNLSGSGFQFCDSKSDNNCSYGSINGSFTSISRVPEPGTLALLGLGLAGLSVSRRRKAA